MIGKIISHYKILEKIGSGGMGVVYKAQDTKLDRFVALKFLPPHLSVGEEEKQRFIQEAKAASRLQHNNICTIHEIDKTHDDQMFICMDYYEGETLKERIERGGLTVKETIDIVTQVTQGLERAHEANIIHRDIKPANITITNKGEVKILDFGLAKFGGQTRLTKNTTILGTVAYMSPEQAQGEFTDHRTDIWSLGVVLYEMLTRQLPFRGEYEQAILYSIINDEPEPLKNVKANLPQELEQVINRALNKNPESRYSSSGEMLRDLENYQKSLIVSGTEPTAAQTLLKLIRKPGFTLPVIIGFVAIGLVAAWFFNRSGKIRWAREVAIPEIKQLVEGGITGFENNIEAYKIALEAENYIPNDPELIDLFSQCAGNFSIKTTPPTANIYMKEYSAPYSEWAFAGVSPIENKRLPSSYFRWRIEKEGYETVTAVWPSFQLDFGKDWLLPIEIEIELERKGTVPTDMVRVKGRGKLNDFYINKYEVSNKRFKEFIVQGGYQKKEFWKNPFVRDGMTLSWEEAMAEFLDATGRPGPATWQAGDYPKGQDNYPVSGISWYEAAAYAEFVGKSLPTISHWRIASKTADNAILHFFSSLLIPLSNFGENGPAALGSFQGMTSNGVFDMAGNVREWCWNKTSKGRCIRGGAWNDVTYMFENVSQAPPFDRSPQNGFRCVRYIDVENIPAEVFQPFYPEKNYRNFYREKPVSDKIFRIYKELFSYDEMDLNPKIESTDNSSENWLKEKITFAAAYGNERLIAYLYLPKNANPPYQTVIYFPGAAANADISSENLESGTEFQNFLSFIMKNGRAVVQPIYKTTYERQLNINPATETHQYKDLQIMLVKDFSRTIDYLETRPEIDSDKLAFYGLSWGGIMGSFIPAVEERLKVSILIVGGLPPAYGKARPDVDLINFVSHVKIPTLMLNGRYDMELPLETAAQPMFDLLGTPEKDKELILYDTAHFIPKNEFIRETLNWLDRYLGPVE